MFLNEDPETRYVIKVFGKIVSIPFATPALAEQQIKNLSPPHQLIAEVVAVTSDGKELLFE